MLSQKIDEGIDRPDLYENKIQIRVTGSTGTGKNTVKMKVEVASRRQRVSAKMRLNDSVKRERASQ